MTKTKSVCMVKSKFLHAIIDILFIYFIKFFFTHKQMFKNEAVVFVQHWKSEGIL